jgi:hypothetical protein
MTPENTHQLCKDFPATFRKDFHFECGDGWEPIIRVLCKAVYARPGPYPRATQVKEKFGGLRFYTDTATSVQSRLIEGAEAKSYRTCEHCGTFGTLRKGSWIKTLCDACNETWQNRKK